jgi:hypothetical protein
LIETRIVVVVVVDLLMAVHETNFSESLKKWLKSTGKGDLKGFAVAGGFVTHRQRHQRS